MAAPLAEARRGRLAADGYYCSCRPRARPSVCLSVCKPWSWALSLSLVQATHRGGQESAKILRRQMWESESERESLMWLVGERKLKFTLADKSIRLASSRGGALGPIVQWRARALREAPICCASRRINANLLDELKRRQRPIIVGSPPRCARPEWAATGELNQQAVVLLEARVKAISRLVSRQPTLASWQSDFPLGSKESNLLAPPVWAKLVAPVCVCE